MHSTSVEALLVYIELMINLPLDYATLSTCIAGTSLHQTHATYTNQVATKNNKKCGRVI